MPACWVLFGLDAACGLIGVTAAAALSPLTVPVTAEIVMGAQMTVGAGDLALRLATTIGACYALGIALHTIFGPARIAGWPLQLDAGFVCDVIVLGISVMDGIVPLNQLDQARQVLTIAPVFCVSFLPLC